MKWLDKITESRARKVAQSTSRRGFLGKLATVVVGTTAAVPLLPVARAEQESKPVANSPLKKATLIVVTIGVFVR